MPETFITIAPITPSIPMHKVPVNATKTTFEIIEALRELDGAGVSELAEFMGMPTSTVHDYLRTLEGQEYLVNDDGTYRIGARFLELGEHFRAGKKIFEVARSEVDELAAETGEHANIMIEEHGWGIFLYKSQGPGAVQLDTHPGMRVHLQTTALGKSILAHTPTEEAEAILDRHGLPAVTENSIVSKAELLDELQTVRERGYAVDDEERLRGIRCVAAPITDEQGDAIAAVSVSAPKSRMKGGSFRTTFPEMVINSANVIEVNIRYT